MLVNVTQYSIVKKNKNMKTLSGNVLIKMGYPENKVIGLALEIVRKAYKRRSEAEALADLKSVLDQPESFLHDATWQRVAALLMPALEVPNREIPLRQSKVEEYTIFGAEHIEQGAYHQMEVAMKLPIAVAGALMPDAHQGYGLPIGGVLATESAVIPYGVGVDIGCRMCLSVFPVPGDRLLGMRERLSNLLHEHARFGRDTFRSPIDHAVLDHAAFREIELLKTLKDKAWAQIGSSGSGNHFVEWGLATFEENQMEGVPGGTYLALLSHSGSRALGASIAGHYTKVARAHTRLPKEAGHLAWLELSSEAGHEYWVAMNLAGDYAAACHHQIHHRMAKALNERVLLRVENHHNFAWKELHHGKEVIVHRKGATPANEGVLGIIPGSMTAPGFIVKGRGISSSINSASHGAGRRMSRSAAKSSISGHMLREELKKNGVQLIGGGLDEAPMAYKDIHEVMGHQRHLIDVLGTFQPKIVRMCGDDTPSED